jgi:hypothetical protein
MVTLHFFITPFVTSLCQSCFYTDYLWYGHAIRCQHGAVFSRAAQVVVAGINDPGLDICRQYIAPDVTEWKLLWMPANQDPTPTIIFEGKHLAPHNMQRERAYQVPGTFPQTNPCPFTARSVPRERYTSCLRTLVDI